MQKAQEDNEICGNKSLLYRAGRQHGNFAFNSGVIQWDKFPHLSHKIIRYRHSNLAELGRNKLMQILKIRSFHLVLACKPLKSENRPAYTFRIDYKLSPELFMHEVSKILFSNL